MQALGEDMAPPVVEAGEAEAVAENIVAG